MGTKNFLKLIISINFFFFIFLFANAEKIELKLSDSIVPYCSGNLISNDDLVIEKLEIKVDKNRNWSKNLLNLHVKFQQEKSKGEHDNWFPNFRISDKYKKKFKAKVYLTYENTNECHFDSLIRVSGDMWWHLGWSKGTPITSINVELLDGHINNITRFKLLLPDSRYGSNEIFTSLIMKHLGFLSPRTFFTKAKINGFTNNYIFQEDLRKEFIENSSYKEGPILEGDERFTISLKDNEHLYTKKTNLSKLANKSYAKKNNLNLNASLEAVTNLNLLYLLNHNAEYPDEIEKNINLYLFSNYYFDNIINKKLLETYDALIYALDATHSLSLDDRRFYYDTIDRSLIPIYYDGKSKILEKQQILKDQDLTQFSTTEAKNGSDNAIAKLKNVNKKNILQDLTKAGVKIDALSLDKLILKINKRLLLIKKSKPKKISVSDDKSYFSKFNIEETRNKKLVFANNNLKEFYICDFKPEKCETIKTSRLEYSLYLANALNQDFTLFNKKLNIKNDLIFVHSNINYENLPYKLSENLVKLNQIRIDDTFIQFNDFVDIKIDHLEKIISINQKNESGIVLFKNGKLSNWNIFFDGKKSNHSLSANKDSQFLTGCLNIYNLSLDNVSFFIKDTNCEDAINFINSKGNIKTINVKNSLSDSIDMDFSNLKIKLINIENSLNDCLDLSYGKYEIKKLTVMNCGDKGVSVGEKSKLKINTLIAEQTNMAVVSKDSSIIFLDNSYITHSDICFAAYRKKQEFSGGKIFIMKKNNCSLEKIYESKGSQIIF